MLVIEIDENLTALNQLSKNVFRSQNSKKIMSSKMQELLNQAAQQSKQNSSAGSSVACANRAFIHNSEAENIFARLKQKLLRINEWNEKSALTSFQLFDSGGVARQEKMATVNDFIRLDLHGSGKYDWVKIIAVDDATDETVLTIKPSFNPTEKQTETSVTSHFFTSDSTNNFCLRRRENTIDFCVIGLNEQTNFADTKNFIETARNFATSNTGYYLGIQKAEWKTFCENFLETGESGMVKE